MRRRFCLTAVFLVAALSCRSVQAETTPSKQPQPDPEYVRKMIPTKIVGTYEGGDLIELRVRDRKAYLVRPTGKVDAQRRWVWIFPFWLGINDGHGNLQHRFYVEKYLASGFHVAGVDVGTSCGSPSAAKVCHEFYEMLREKYALNRRARLLGQSNGGLIAYAWGFRHPDCADRIGGICPATDFRTWPTLPNVVAFPEQGLGYDLTYEQLAARQTDFNPIDRLASLAKSGVKILHVHGDQDELVPMAPNSTELVLRYRALGGSADTVVLAGLGHGGKEFYESRPLLAFLLAD